MDIKSIHSRAPTRIDLAGGTLDIWPLYLFLKHSLTLNLGIDLFAEASIELLPRSEANSGQVILRSDDQRNELKIPWNRLQQASQVPPGLELHYKLLNFFLEKRKQKGEADLTGDLVLRTLARSPAGAGLGGSSALSIALIGALATWAAGTSIDPLTEGESFIEIVRDVETTVIQVPAGLQDYYGSMYGGLQALRWGAGTHSRETLPEEIMEGLEKRLLLFYSGQSRNSGINNWSLFKGFIDGQDGIRDKFDEICAATRKLEKALQAQSWADVGTAIRDEWAVRKTLAAGITTPEIDRAFTAASQLTPISGKVCGAGGGGCFFIYLPNEFQGNSHDDAHLADLFEIKEKIKKTVSAHGMRSLDFHRAPHGLEVQVTRE